MWLRTPSAAIISGLCFLSASSQALAQNDIAQQLLRESFACPAEQYVCLDNPRTHIDCLDRSYSIGDGATLKVRVDTRQMEIEESTRTVTITAAYKDLASVSLLDNDRVAISCKPNRLCITTVWRDADRPAETLNSAPDWNFRTCSRAASDNIRAAIEQLVNQNRGN